MRVAPSKGCHMISLVTLPLSWLRWMDTDVHAFWTLALRWPVYLKHSIERIYIIAHCSPFNLQVVGASGKPVPYVGYTEVSLRFSESTASVSEEMATLALVTPSRDGHDRTPLLLGTNTNVIKRMLQRCKEQAGPDFLQKIKVSCAWAGAYRAMDAASCISTSDGFISSVRLCGDDQITVRSGESTEIHGITTIPFDVETPILVEAGEGCVMPGGLVIRCTLCTLPAVAKSEVKLHVCVSNEANHDIVLPPGQ